MIIVNDTNGKYESCFTLDIYIEFVDIYKLKSLYVFQWTYRFR